VNLEPVALLNSSVARVGRFAGGLPYVLLIALMVWLLGWYWTTAASLEAIWAHSATFQHGYTILPISLALIWSRRRQLREIPPKPVFWPLLLLAPLGLGWLLADLAEVAVVRQYALVLMAPVLVTALLGVRFAWAIAFPLMFLVLAVPFGEFLLPPMIEFTADFTVGALRLTGIPVFREGPNFTLPSGSWSVVEACSGLRYLIASFTLGCLYAYLNYRSLRYRLIFIALSLLVPILANGMRAYLIVIIGHVSNMQLAVGVDHYIYGWVFFGVVIGLLFWAGSFWREDMDAPAHVQQFKQDAVPTRASPTKLLMVALTGATLGALWPAYAAYVASPFHSMNIRIEPPEVGGWRRSDVRLSTWRPHYMGARAHINQVFEKNGRRVGLYIGYYNNQNEHAKLISASNALTVTLADSWSTVSKENVETPIEEKGRLLAEESKLRGPDGRLLAWHWFWVEGERTNNAYVTKMLQAKSRLLGRGDDSAVVILYTATEDRVESSRAVLNEFIQDALPAVEKVLANVNRE
jgi:exosortase A